MSREIETREQALKTGTYDDNRELASQRSMESASKKTQRAEPETNKYKSLAQLKQDGASVAELYDHIKGHVRVGAEANNIARDVNKKIEQLNTLSGMDRFDKLVEYGFVEPGSRYIPQAGNTISYIKPDQLKRLLTTRSASIALRPYIKSDERQPSYLDINAAVKGGVSDITLRNAGIKQADIKAARNIVKTPQAVAVKPKATLTADDTRYAAVPKENKPSAAEVVPMSDYINGYFKDKGWDGGTVIPRSVIIAAPDKSQKLLAQYSERLNEARKAYTEQYGTGRYLKEVAAEAPMKSLQLGAALTPAAPAIALSSAFIKGALGAKGWKDVSWPYWLTSAIGAAAVGWQLGGIGQPAVGLRGRVTDATKSVKSATQQYNRLVSRGASAKAIEAARYKVNIARGSLSRAIFEFNNGGGRLSGSQIKSIERATGIKWKGQVTVPGMAQHTLSYLTTDTMPQIQNYPVRTQPNLYLPTGFSGTYGRGVSVTIPTGKVVVSLGAVTPGTVVPATPLPVIAPYIVPTERTTVTKSKPATETQPKYVPDVKILPGTKTETETETETKTVMAPEVVIRPETFLLELTKDGIRVNTTVRTGTKAASDTALSTETETKAATKAATEAKTTAKTKTTAQATTQQTPSRLAAATATPSPAAPLMFGDLPVSQIGERELTKEELATAIAWPQGFGWWIIFKKGNRFYSFFHKGERPPQGIKPVPQGKGEAYRGIQRFRGQRVNALIYKPLGIVTASISEPEVEPGRGGSISFRANMVSKSRPRIDKRRPIIR